MSYQATAYVDQTRLGSHPTAKHVAAVVAHHHDSRTGRAEIYVQEIVENSELSERTVRRALKLLQQIGELREVVKGNRSVKSIFEFVNLGRAATQSQTAVTESKTPVTVSRSAVNVTAETGTIRKEEEVEQVEENHHSFAGLIPAWIRIKEQLKTKLSSEEWRLWVRPMFLLRVMDEGRFLLFSLPANDRIIKAATAKRAMLIDLLQPHGCARCSFTRYPDEYELERLSQQHPEFYEQLPEALKKRRPEKVSA
jgi:Fe2+ or Zn2+ uptake regulation protein